MRAALSPGVPGHPLHPPCPGNCTGVPAPPGSAPQPWEPHGPESPTATHGAAEAEEGAEDTQLCVTTGGPTKAAQTSTAQLRAHPSTRNTVRGTGAAAEHTRLRGGAMGSAGGCHGCVSPSTGSAAGTDAAQPPQPRPGAQRPAVPLPAPSQPRAGTASARGSLLGRVTGDTQEVPAAPRSPQPPGPYKAAGSSHVAPDLVCF